jgi:hypothetical protein
VRALGLALLLVLPALAGCAAPAGERLDRADVSSQTAAASADASTTWAPLASATIRPGVVIHTADGDCQSNFVFSRQNATQAFIGTTANCVRKLPIGAIAAIGNPRNIGILVYSSWITMQDVGEQDAGALEYNDFAVFYVDSSSRAMVNPALPQTGGPTGADDAGALGTGARLRFWGKTPSVAESGNWHDAVVTGKVGGWALLAHGVLPGAPGTMGGGVVTPEGKAVGVLVNLAVSPDPGANGVARLDKVMSYASEHAKMDMDLATWDFTPGSY